MVFWPILPAMIKRLFLIVVSILVVKGCEISPEKGKERQTVLKKELSTGKIFIQTITGIKLGCNRKEFTESMDSLRDKGLITSLDLNIDSLHWDKLSLPENPTFYLFPDKKFEKDLWILSNTFKEDKLTELKLINSIIFNHIYHNEIDISLPLIWSSILKEGRRYKTEKKITLKMAEKILEENYGQPSLDFREDEAIWIDGNREIKLFSEEPFRIIIEFKDHRSF